jgi:hypothetical protein
MGNTHTDNSKNILYLGMGSDIYTPLVLCPNFKVLYAIDKDNQRKEIMEHLLSGKCTRYADYDVRTVKLSYRVKNFEVKIANSKKWEVNFTYNNLPRTLIIYTQDFYKSWPDDIVEINTVLTIGAVFALDPNCKYDSDVNKINIEHTKKMLNQRTTPLFRYIMGCNFQSEYDSIYKKFRLKGSETNELNIDKYDPSYKDMLEIMTIKKKT